MAQMYVVIAVHVSNDEIVARLCVSDGYKNNVFQTLESAKAFADEMRPQFPDAKYVVQEVINNPAIKFNFPE